MTDEKQMVGRLALRVEGDCWVAYYALPDSMEGAIEMARISMALVQNVKRKRAFMDLMRDGVAEFFENMTGNRPDFEVRRAPEHERAGRA